MRLKADLLLFMVAVIWGTAFVAQGVAGQYGVAYLYNGISCVIIFVGVLISQSKSWNSGKIEHDHLVEGR